MAQIASMEAVVAARVPSAAVASTSARHTVVAGAWWIWEWFRVFGLDFLFLSLEVFLV